MIRNLPSLAVLAAVALAAASLAGCGKSPDAKYAGTWELDKEVIMEAMMAEIAAVEDPAERQMMEMGMAMMGASMLDTMSMTLTLNADGTVTSTTHMMGESDTVHGRWSSRGRTVTIEVTQDGETESITAEFDGDAALEVIPPEGEDVPFRMVMRRQPR